MTQSILFLERFKKKGEVKAIDYIIAAPAAIAVSSFINGFKHDNPFMNFGRYEFSLAASMITLQATAEVVASYRNFIVDAINDIREV